MDGGSFLRVDADEQSRAYDTLVSAFTDDPVERWMYPDLDDYLQHFPEFLAAFGGRAFRTQTVWRLESSRRSRSGYRLARSLTTSASSACLPTASHPALHGDLFAVSSKRWTAPTLAIRIGTSRGLGLRLPSKERDSAAS